MKTPWATDVALNLSRLMEKTWYPSHGGLDTIFGKLAIDSPETDRQGSSINKVKRLRRASTRQMLTVSRQWSTW